ncbi:MAG: FecR domain-containing protein [Rhodopirellula sp. JB053]
MNATPQWEQYRSLRDAALDGRISAEQMAMLEQLVLRHEDLRRDYAEHAHQQAVLKWTFAALPELKLQELVRPNGASTVSSAVSSHSATGSSRYTGIMGGHRFIWHLLAMAAGVFLTVGLLEFWDAHDGLSKAVATIASSEDCKWGDCTLATAVNQPLGPGHLRLESGIATLQFPNVSVTLEGQVDLEIVDEKMCLLHSGRVLANVEPGGEGFVVQTPTAKFIDRGTTFGVKVAPSGVSDLTVFKGRVDVGHLLSGAEASVRVNETMRASQQLLETLDDANDEGPVETPVAGVPIHISTASGAGDDAYVAAAKSLPARSSSDIALLVKKPAKSKPRQWYAPWRRKAFMRFDLASLTDGEIVEAVLQLQGVETNIGYASMMPDATFAVYGLTDESQDFWDASEINWMNSPANAGNTVRLMQSDVQLIGRFVVPQSDPAGRFEVSGETLADFLSEDTNGVVTLIIIPETVGEPGESYVHGFASKRHPFLPAPTLRLRVQ